MGTSKAALRLGNQTMLGYIRSRATSAGLTVRVIERDLVRRCGPLGGIFTALSTTSCEGVLFLSCDMPFVSVDLLRRLLSEVRQRSHALFFKTPEGLGFPFWLRATALAMVEKQIARRQYSLQRLAEILRAKTVHPSATERDQLFNINTPADWESARERFRTGAWK
jgi:molybdopterin-guanine dinucleotide biosynthesis protein A